MKPVEKWIVITVKDIEFERRTSAQLDEEKRVDDERPRQYPKYCQDYLLTDTKFCDCHYHDGYAIDVDEPRAGLAIDQARMKMQRAEILK